MRTQIHTPRHASMHALCYKVKNDRKIASPELNDQGRSVTLMFLFMDNFLYRFSTISDKMKKIYRLEL